MRAFHDTWRDGIHSYLTYLRDRLSVARDLLHETGSIFVQIGYEAVHRVRALMDKVFGEDNLVSEIVVQKTYGFSSQAISNVSDFLYCGIVKAAKLSKAGHSIARRHTSLAKGCYERERERERGSCSPGPEALRTYGGASARTAPDRRLPWEGIGRLSWGWRAGAEARSEL